MNKNIAIYVSIAVALGVGGLIFFSGTDDYQSQYDSLKNGQAITNQIQNKAAQEDKKNDKDIKIDYQTSTPKTDQTKPQKPQREKFVEAKSVDASGRFEISLINEQAWDENRETSKMIMIFGKIDGKNFDLLVPDYLTKLDSEIKIKVRNNETNATKIMSAPFLKNLPMSGQKNQLELDSEDMSNFSFTKKQTILPNID